MGLISRIRKWWQSFLVRRRRPSRSRRERLADSSPTISREMAAQRQESAPGPDLPSVECPRGFSYVEATRTEAVNEDANTLAVQEAGEGECGPVALDNLGSTSASPHVEPLLLPPNGEPVISIVQHREAPELHPRESNGFPASVDAKVLQLEALVASALRTAGDDENVVPPTTTTKGHQRGESAAGTSGDRERNRVDDGITEPPPGSAEAPQELTAFGPADDQGPGPAGAAEPEPLELPRASESGELLDQSEAAGPTDGDISHPSSQPSPALRPRHQPPSPFGPRGAALDLTSEGTHGRGLPPEMRGGRPRGPLDEPRTNVEHSWMPKPELVCFRRERSWCIGVELQEEQPAGGECQVILGDRVLETGEHRSGTWVLEGAEAEVRVMIDGKEIAAWHLDEIPFLLFRLSGGHRARLVRSFTHGEYLVVVKSGSRVSLDSIQPCDVMREPVELEGFEGWHCWLEGPQVSIHVGTRAGQRL